MPEVNFVAEPEVRLAARRATHVTVKSPTAEGSASLGGIPVEDMIEHIIYIEAGSAFVCESSAQALLDAWKEESVSVTGTIEVTVLSRFRERIGVFIPTAGIDDDLILQKKVHNVAEGTSTLTLGTAYFSDQELLTRVLEDITGLGLGITRLDHIE